MTFKQYIKEFSKEYEGTGSFWYKSKLFALYDQLKNNEKIYLSQLEVNYNNQSQFKGHYEKFKKNHIDILNKQDLGILFVELKTIQENISKNNEMTKVIGIDTQNILQKLLLINTHFNKVFRSPSDFNLIKIFLTTIDSFNDEFVKMRINIENIKKIEKLLDNSIKTEKDYSKLYLSFYDENDDFDDFTESLVFIRDIYNELIFLFNLNEQVNKLKIIKIESGSKSFDIFGNKHILDFMKWLITEIVNFLFKSFSYNGKIEKITYNIESLEKQFKLVNKIEDLNSTLSEEARINLDEAKDSISKSLVLITKKTTLLIQKQTKIEIDNKLIILDDELKDKYIEENKKMLIESNI